MKEVLYKLVDLSAHNGKVNWDLIEKDGYDGIIQRVGYGTDNLDPTAYDNIDEALKRNMIVGVFWFMYSLNVEEAIQEAKNFDKYIKRYKGKLLLPVYADYEGKSDEYANEQGVYPTQKDRTEMIKAFCLTLRELGWYVGNYGNPDYIKTKWYQSELDEFELWVANYEVDTPEIEGGIWQYTKTGPRYGDGSKYTDLDYVYKDYPEIIKKNGYNGFQKDEPYDGFRKWGNYLVYYRKSGTQAFGWQKINGFWYFFRKNTGTMVTAWQKINNRWRFFDLEGRYVGDGYLERKSSPWPID